jgi:4-amino-4-deoxy-L-arabinose transferase
MKKSCGAIIGLFLLLYISPLGVRPIIIPDESRYAEVPREMIASGDWIVPHLNGLRYFEKPVLGYWINATSMILLGENAFAVRLPSAMAAGISALMLFILLRKFEGEYSIGVLAASIFLTCLEVLAVGTFSVLDNLLSMFLTGAMVSFFFAHREGRPLKKYCLLALSGIFCGLAFLTKGFIALVIPLVTILPFMVWERRWKELFQVCWIPVFTAVLVSLPWAVMIQIREPNFWHFFFWNEHIRRFIADNAQHKQPFLYFSLILPGVALPWSFLFPTAASGLKQTDFKNPIIRIAICWFLFPFLFFSLCSGKLLTYILPCFPPLAILTAVGLHNYLKGERKKTFNGGTLLFALVIAILAVALVGYQVAGFCYLKPYAQVWKCLFAVGGLLSWTLFLLLSARESRAKKKIILYGTAPVLFMFLGHFILPDPVAEHKAPGEFLLHHSHKIQADTILVSDEDFVLAACWFYKRSDVYLLQVGGELTYGLHYDDSKHRLLNLDQFRQVILTNRGRRLVTLIIGASNYQKWKQYLPEPLFKDTKGDDGLVFVQY